MSIDKEQYFSFGNYVDFFAKNLFSFVHIQFLGNLTTNITIIIKHTIRWPRGYSVIIGLDKSRKYDKISTLSTLPRLPEISHF